MILFYHFSEAPCAKFVVHGLTQLSPRNSGPSNPHYRYTTKDRGNIPTGKDFNISMVTKVQSATIIPTMLFNIHVYTQTIFQMYHNITVTQLHDKALNPHIK